MGTYIDRLNKSPVKKINPACGFRGESSGRVQLPASGSGASALGYTKKEGTKKW